MEHNATWLEGAEEAARAGGEQLRHWRDRFQVSEKGRFDLVTDADHASQSAIRKVLLRRFPAHHFLGEETPAAERQQLLQTREPLWVVDPLDGTTNYVHDLPCYAVSIGLVVAGQVVVGVVYDPMREELFAAGRGQGARLNGRPLRCSSATGLPEALLAVGFPSVLQGKEYMVEAWKEFSYQCQGLRRTGSSAINMAYVAAGRLEGFFAHEICPWDIAGGMVLVEEAGGTVTNPQGARYEPLSGESLVASNGPLQAEMLKTLNRVLPGDAR